MCTTWLPTPDLLTEPILEGSIMFCTIMRRFRVWWIRLLKRSFCLAEVMALCEFSIDRIIPWIGSFSLVLTRPSKLACLSKKSAGLVIQSGEFTEDCRDLVFNRMSAMYNLCSRSCYFEYVRFHQPNNITRIIYTGFLVFDSHLQISSLWKNKPKQRSRWGLNAADNRIVSINCIGL